MVDDTILLVPVLLADPKTCAVNEDAVAGRVKAGPTVIDSPHEVEEPVGSLALTI